MKIMKKFWALLIVSAILGSTFSFFVIPAFAAGSSIESATKISLATTYNESITDEYDQDYYYINLASSGELHINFTSYMEYYSFMIYDKDGELVWYTDGNEYSSTSEMRTDNHYIDLEKGTYYFVINGNHQYDNGYYHGTGNYKFTIKFTASGANIAEPNNSIGEAKKILTGKTIKGQIAENDRIDFYKYYLSESGRVSVKFTSYMKYYSFMIYDKDGELLWYTDGNEYSSTSEMRTDNHYIDLEKGTYYFVINGNHQYDNGYYHGTGNYKFTIKFTASGANIAEPNDSIKQAKKISLGSTVKGQIAINDREDFYKFTVPYGCYINIDFVSYMKYFSFMIYDENGELYEYSNGNELKDLQEKSSNEYNYYLKKGTYYFVVNGNSTYDYDYYRSTGKYSFEIYRDRTIYAPSSFTATSTTSSITLKWSKVKNADGYYLYRYYSSTGKSKKIATLDKNTTSYVVDNLSAGAISSYKIVAYQTLDGHKYTTYPQYIKTAAKPKSSGISTVTAGTKKAILTWKKNSTASGYQVFVSTSKNGTYRKLLNTTKLQYTKTGLTSGKTYYFKIRAYKKVDGKYIFSAYSSEKHIRVK